MFTGIGAMLGIFGSAVNRGIGMFERRQKADIAEKKRSDAYEMSKLNAGKDSVVASYDHDKKLAEGVSQWVSNIRALVRPAITGYAFIIVSVIYFNAVTEVKALVATVMLELLSTVVTWWFADRFKR